MFVKSHQFVSEILEIQDKFQHDCRIALICIRGFRNCFVVNISCAICSNSIVFYHVHRIISCITRNVTFVSNCPPRFLGFGTCLPCRLMSYINVLPINQFYKPKDQFLKILQRILRISLLKIKVF